MSDTVDIKLSEAHIYTDAEGRTIPGVTEIIQSVRTGYRYQPNEWYLTRGTAVHSAIQLAAHDKLDWDKWNKDLFQALQPQQAAAVIGRTKAALKFLTENFTGNFTTEIRLHNKMLNYAGTADLVGELKDGRLCICDWKGMIEPFVQIQLGFYSLALKIKPVCALAVELHDDSTFRCLWGSRQPKRDKSAFDLGHAERTSMAVLTYRNFLVKNRLLQMQNEP